MQRGKGCYEILIDYESKLSQIKFPLFYIFHELHEFSFLEIYISVNKAILLIFDWTRDTSNSI